MSISTGILAIILLVSSLTCTAQHSGFHHISLQITFFWISFITYHTFLGHRSVIYLQWLTSSSLLPALNSPASVTFYLEYSAGLAFLLQQLMKNNLTVLTFILCHLFSINHLVCFYCLLWEAVFISLSLTLSAFNSLPLPLCAFYLTTPKSSLPHMASSVFWTWLCTPNFFLHNHVCDYLNIIFSPWRWR